MRLLRSACRMLLALLVTLIPASSYAGVFISVGFAPPVLPVYVQPVCPQPGLMWMPGYWAYGPDGYYWVPGAWVPAPYEGALWTPGYWGWSAGLYMWHPGYWGRHVGYYGGVNYGFGYMGIGFVGGVWRGGIFAYNTAVMHVGVGGGWGGNRVYEDRTVINRYTVVNNHVAFSGGPGGINHPPTAEERIADHDQHTAPTSFQTQRENSARSDTNAYASHNGGRPSNVTVSGSAGMGTRPNTGGAGNQGAINYNASKSNTGNRTVQTTSQNSSSGGGRAGAVNYNSSKSNSGNFTAHSTNGGNGQGRTVNNTTTRSNTQHNSPAPVPQSHGAPKPGQR